MMLSIASRPSSIPLMGTPMTGRVVEAAMTPGRAAAIPAAAMMTFSPRSLASRANCSTASGVRWAERALTSKGTCISLSSWQAFSITGRSDVLPMIMLTNGFILFFLKFDISIFRHFDITMSCHRNRMAMAAQMNPTQKPTTTCARLCWRRIMRQLPNTPATKMTIQSHHTGLNPR